MSIIERMLKEKIVDNGFHAAGMLNKLECATLESDEERIARCKLYIAWQGYYKAAQEFTNEKAMKNAARLKAIEGAKVPELPMVEAQ